MYNTCPDCNQQTVIEPTGYGVVLEMVEAGTYKPMCATCGVSWKLTPEELKYLTAELRLKLAQPRPV